MFFASANSQNREKRRPPVQECSIFSSLFSRIIFQSFGRNGSTLTTDWSFKTETFAKIFCPKSGDNLKLKNRLFHKYKIFFLISKMVWLFGLRFCLILDAQLWLFMATKTPSFRMSILSIWKRTSKIPGTYLAKYVWHYWTLAVVEKILVNYGSYCTILK